MKATIKKDVLAAALYRVQGVAERKTTTPVLSHALIEALKEGQLRISATDLELAVTGDYPAKVEAPGKALVSARALFEITRNGAGDDVSLRSRDEKELEVKVGRSEWKLLGLAPSEFPSLPNLGGVETFSVGGAEISALVQRTLYAASQDESRHNLNGVLFEGFDGGLRLVAADGHRLSKSERKVKRVAKSGMKTKVIVPRKAMNELKRLLEDFEGDCEIGFTANTGLVKVGNVVLLVRLIEGKYPDYEQVIPKATEWRAVAARADVIAALKRVTILSSDQSWSTRLELEENIVRFVVSNPDAGTAREEIAAEYGGRKFQMGFNARYLSDALASFECDRVNLEFNDELSPIVVRPCEEDGADATVAIVMPMRI